MAVSTGVDEWQVDGLGQHLGVSLDRVQEKFVGRDRGGYCFEHSTTS